MIGLHDLRLHILRLHVQFVACSLSHRGRGMAGKIPKEVSLFYFKYVGDERWECKCTNKRKQIRNKGYSNLNTHIHADHPNWREEYRASLARPLEFVPPRTNKTGENIFHWLEWTIFANLPFSFCENEFARKYTRLDNLSSDSLIRYLDKTVEAVEKKITKILPKQFVLIFDGLTFNSVHYFAIYAAFAGDDASEGTTILLAISPLLDEENMDAKSHYDFIVATLNIYNKKVDSVMAVIGDNENLNKAISKLLKVPFIGCANHRLNLAVNKFLTQYEPLLDKIQILMVKLSSLKRSAALRKSTTLRPVLRNKTRWSSTMHMISRFMEIKDYIPANDTELLPFILDDDDYERISTVHKDLIDIESVTKILQTESGNTLSDVRTMFDDLIAKFPVMDYHLSKDAEIVMSKDFENAVVKCLDKKSSTLTSSEILSLKKFEEPIQVLSGAPTLSFAEASLQAKRLKLQDNGFQRMDWLPPTSNVCERLFSRAKLTFGQCRQKLSPMHLEAELFLFVNKTFWDAELVSTLV